MKCNIPDWVPPLRLDHHHCDRRTEENLWKSIVNRWLQYPEYFLQFPLFIGIDQLLLEDTEKFVDFDASISWNVHYLFWVWLRNSNVLVVVQVMFFAPLDDRFSLGIFISASVLISLLRRTNTQCESTSPSSYLAIILMRSPEGFDEIVEQYVENAGQALRWSVSRNFTMNARMHEHSHKAKGNDAVFPLLFLPYWCLPQRNWLRKGNHKSLASLPNPRPYPMQIQLQPSSDSKQSFRNWVHHGIASKKIRILPFNLGKNRALWCGRGYSPSHSDRDLFVERRS